MISKSYLKALALCLLVQTSTSHDGHDHGEEHGSEVDKSNNGHQIDLKSCGGVDFKWLSDNDTWITIEIKSFTKGYVSIGFCPQWKNTMEGCDIVVGWVGNHDGKAYLYDYYAWGNSFPELDESQDYELLEGKQEHGRTSIKFRRKWDTKDSYDADFGSKVRVMWAWHPEDPSNSTSFFKHAGNSRGHMMDDISLRTPNLNERHHDHFHSSGSSVFNAKISISGLILVTMISLYLM